MKFKSNEVTDFERTLMQMYVRECSVHRQLDWLCLCVSEFERTSVLLFVADEIFDWMQNV